MLKSALKALSLTFHESRHKKLGTKVVTQRMIIQLNTQFFGIEQPLMQPALKFS